MAEETRGAKWRAAAPDVVHRLGDRVHDEPKHAADFREEAAAELADALHDDDRIARERAGLVAGGAGFGVAMQVGNCLSSQGGKGKSGAPAGPGGLVPMSASLRQ